MSGRDGLPDPEHMSETQIKIVQEFLDNFGTKLEVLVDQVLTRKNVTSYDMMDYDDGVALINYLVSWYGSMRGEDAGKDYESPAELKAVIQTIQDQVLKLKDKIQEIIEPFIPDGDVKWAYTVRTMWECPTSPVGCCVYNHIKDPALDGCIFCHQPYERK
jgi:hypothetical protein